MRDLLQFVRQENLISIKACKIIEEIFNGDNNLQDKLEELERQAKEEEEILNDFIEKLSNNLSSSEEQVKQSVKCAKKILFVHPWLYSIIFFMLNDKKISMRFVRKTIENFETIENLPSQLLRYILIIYPHLIARNQYLLNDIYQIMKKTSNNWVKIVFKLSQFLLGLPENLEYSIIVLKKEDLEELILDFEGPDRENVNVILDLLANLLGANILIDLNYVDDYMSKIPLRYDYEWNFEDLNILIMENVVEMLSNISKGNLYVFIQEVLYEKQHKIWLIIKPNPEDWPLSCLVFSLELIRFGENWKPIFKVLLDPQSRDGCFENYLSLFMKRYYSGVDKDAILQDMIKLIQTKLVNSLKEIQNCNILFEKQPLVYISSELDEEDARGINDLEINIDLDEYD